MTWTMKVMCCANERNIVGRRFDDRETIEMLALVGSEVWPVSNFIQQLPTSRNNTQHGVQTVATCWAQQCCVLLANNVASVCTGLKTFSYFIACVKTRNSIVSNYHVLQVQTLSWRTFSLNNDAQNSRQAFFQIILDCHISNYFFYLTLLNP